MKKAIVLLSGGLDSATTLYIARDKGYKCYSLIFEYNQRHKKEVTQAKSVAKKARSDYKVVKLSFPWQGSALLNKKAKLPSGRNIKNMAKGIPSTYVPVRNTIFLSIGSAWAEAIGADAVFIGANAVDVSGYPDCRPEYFNIFRNVLRKGTRRGVEGRTIKVETPLIDKKKSEIIKIGKRLDVPYHLTWSCYEGGKKPCCRCESCLLRQKGFEEAGAKDPLLSAL